MPSPCFATESRSVFQRTRGDRFSMTAMCPPGPTNQPTVGDAAEINSGSHRSGAKLNFPFPESTPRTPRTPPTPRRERAQAHMGAHAPARTRTRALTLKLLLSGSRCVHCPFLTRSPSLPSPGTVQCHARAECRSAVTIFFLIPFQVRLLRLFSPAELLN